MARIVIRYCWALILGLTVLWLPQAGARTSAPLFAVQLTANAASTKVTIGLGQSAPFHAAWPKAYADNACRHATDQRRSRIYK